METYSAPSSFTNCKSSAEGSAGNWIEILIPGAFGNILADAGTASASNAAPAKLPVSASFANSLRPGLNSFGRFWSFVLSGMLHRLHDGESSGPMVMEFIRPRKARIADTEAVSRFEL